MLEHVYFKVYHKKSNSSEPTGYDIFLDKHKADAIVYLTNDDLGERPTDPLAYILLYIDNVQDIDNKLTIYIGYIHSKSPSLTEKLLKEFAIYCDKMGYEKIIGPIQRNFLGFKGYKEHFTNSSQRIYDHITYQGERTDKFPEKELSDNDFFTSYNYYALNHKMTMQLYPLDEDENYIFEAIDEKTYEKYIDELYEVTMLAYEKEPLFSEIKFDDFKEIMKNQFVGRQGKGIVVITNNKVIGFSMGYESKTLDYTCFLINNVAVLPNYRNKLIGTSLYIELCNKALMDFALSGKIMIEMNIITSQIHQNNPLINIIESNYQCDTQCIYKVFERSYYEDELPFTI